jgi:hypothetical protein
MTYNADMTWIQVSGVAGNYARILISALTEGQKAYDEWQSFRAGRTNLEIATALSVTEAAVADLDSCYSAMLAVYNYADNQTPAQGDYFYSLRKFS